MLTGVRLPQRRLLSQIVFLLWILALFLALAFCYFASSLCITVLLASFLAILVDPAIVGLQRLRISRTLASAIVIVAASALVGTLAYLSYKQISDVIDDLPMYAGRVGNAIAPLSNKIEKVRDSAGGLDNQRPSKKVPEVKVKAPTWTSYLIRGAGPVGGAAIIIGVVPFLMFFLLIQKRRLRQKLAIVLGDNIDVSAFLWNVTGMVRGYVLGNLLTGSLLALVTAIVLLVLKVEGAVILGAVSGFLNLIPFLGAIMGALVPIGAALIQSQPLGTLAIILVTVVALHTISMNLLMPKLVGPRVSINPVAATVGILFWGWLWGAFGVLLAVPLTALVKIVADLHPSLTKLAHLIAERPDGRPPPPSGGLSPPPSAHEQGREGQKIARITPFRDAR